MAPPGSLSEPGFVIAPVVELGAAFVARVPIAALDAQELPGWRLLHEAEQAWSLRQKSRRQVEFVAGRAALRLALRRAGWQDDEPLLPGEQGRPSLPTGYTASITHKAGLALALAAPARRGRTLGIDCEVVDRDRSSIASKILRPEEQLRWGQRGQRWRDLLEIFSTKEAIYKALHPHVPRYISFAEAEVEGETIRLHLAQGEGPFVLRRIRWWEGERLISIVEAGPA